MKAPLCAAVSLAAAGECLVDAATHLRAAVSDVADAVGFCVVALAQGPTMRASLRPMPPESAEAEARWAEALEMLRAATLAEDRRRGSRTPVCVCGDYPVTVAEPCAACAEVAS